MAPQCTCRVVSGVLLRFRVCHAHRSAFVEARSCTGSLGSARVRVASTSAGSGPTEITTTHIIATATATIRPATRPSSLFSIRR